MKQFANNYLFSDVDPFEVIKVISDKTIEVRSLIAIRNFEVEWIGSEVQNKFDQEWIFKQDPNAAIIRLHKRKDGNYYKGDLKFVLSDYPIKRYDYRF